MEREWIGSEDVIGRANKKCRVVSWPAIATAAMLDVKEEHIIVEEVDGSDVKISYKVIKWAMKSAFFGTDVPFQGLMAAVEKSCEDIIINVQVVICYLPYTSRWVVKISTSQHAQPACRI